MPTGRRRADTVLRVDGGMTASDVNMQFLADILGAPVDRPWSTKLPRLGRPILRATRLASAEILPGFRRLGGSIGASSRYDRRYARQ